MEKEKKKKEEQTEKTQGKERENNNPKSQVEEDSEDHKQIQSSVPLVRLRNPQPQVNFAVSHNGCEVYGLRGSPLNGILEAHKQIQSSVPPVRVRNPQVKFAVSHNGCEVYGLRGSPLNGILEALTNPNINMIGVCGSNNEHKAVLVERIRRRVKRDNLFDLVLMASVTKKPDYKKIQQELGSNLGLQFEPDNTAVARAKSLCDRIMQEKKILVVLDDLWAEINFGGLGIPFGNDHKGCKILLISVSSEVLALHVPTQNYFLVP